MTDFYVMLGLTRTATPEEIRAAYLERMKVLHPDRHAPTPPGAPSAADLNYAYWILRDAQRRAAYDRTLAPLDPRPRRRSRHSGRAVPKPAPRRPFRKQSYYPRRSAVSRRTRATAAILFVLIAAAAGAGTLTMLRPERGQAAWARGGTDDHKRLDRRILDESLASAAALEFETILRSAGFPGASLYGRQCFDELAAQPSAAMVDYCLAFDRTAAEWETTLVTSGGSRRYFDAGSRVGRYRSLADSLDEGPVREAIVAEAAFLTGS
ncbi:MAG: J domain-containing protein [Allosphingosinicella sp.]|uniref:J domain-containing protein n=1 Tax=Allosphingosinicella sp. TaxID=2823234 RepID=UPI003949B51F